jgi:hypothetical protein
VILRRKKSESLRFDWSVSAHRVSRHAVMDVTSLLLVKGFYFLYYSFQVSSSELDLNLIFPCLLFPATLMQEKEKEKVARSMADHEFDFFTVFGGILIGSCALA